jgi:hypothetical protein
MPSPEGHGSAGKKEGVDVASPSHAIESRMLGDGLATKMATDFCPADGTVHEPAERMFRLIAAPLNDLHGVWV